MTITTNILNTDHVKELLHKAAGLDKETGSTRNKQIMHRLLTDIYTMIEDLDITPEEFWQWSVVGVFRKVSSIVSLRQCDSRARLSSHLSI